MKFRPRSSNVTNHCSHVTWRSRSLSPCGKSNRSTPSRSPCSVPSTAAGTPSRASAHSRITSWLVVTRLRPGCSGSSSGEVISWAYFSDLELLLPRRAPPPTLSLPAVLFVAFAVLFLVPDREPPSSSPPAFRLVLFFAAARCAFEIALTSSSLRKLDAPLTPSLRASCRSSSTFLARSSVSLRSGVFGVWLPGLFLPADAWRRRVPVRSAISLPIPGRRYSVVHLTRYPRSGRQTFRPRDGDVRSCRRRASIPRSVAAVGRFVAGSAHRGCRAARTVRRSARTRRTATSPHWGSG